MNHYNLLIIYKKRRNMDLFQINNKLIYYRIISKITLNIKKHSIITQKINYDLIIICWI